MTIDKAVDSGKLDNALEYTANRIRAKTSGSSGIAFDLTNETGFGDAIDDIPTGSTPTGTITITQNGTGIDVAQYAAADVNVQGGGSVEEKDINFYDYDGTCVEAWTLAELQSKTALPNNPDHTGDGLTSQGWNWTLTDLKTQNTKMDVGQHYVTTDGKTRIYVTMSDGRLSPYLGLMVNGSVDVDWGDNTAHSTITGTSVSTVVFANHSYAEAGDYVITLTITGEAKIGGENSYGTLYTYFFVSSTSGARGADDIYLNCIREIKLGNNIRAPLGGLNRCYRLEKINIPNTLTELNMTYCASIKCIVLPLSALGNITIQNCNSLTICSIPKLSRLNNYFLSSNTVLKDIYLPVGLTSIAINSLRGNNISEISIPSGVTTIEANAFNGTKSLACFTVPASLTTIGTMVLYQCSFLGYIKFLGPNPPTASSTNWYTGIPTDCKILVPSGSLAAYTSATNYPSSSTYTYEEY